MLSNFFQMTIFRAQLILFHMHSTHMFPLTQAHDICKSYKFYAGVLECNSSANLSISYKEVDGPLTCKFGNQRTIFKKFIEQEDKIDATKVPRMKNKISRQ